MSGVVGVRLGRSGPLVWAACEPEQLPPGSLCLLRTPEGERSARIAVAPGQLLSPVPAAAGYVILRALSDAEALEVEPASGLQRLEHDPEIAGFRLSPSPDGALLTLVAAAPESPEPAIPPDIPRTDSVVVVRDERGRIRDPALPGLLKTVPYEGETWTVTRISVFRAEVELTADDGRTAVVPLDALPRRKGHTVSG